MEQKTTSRTEKFCRNVRFAILAQIVTYVLAFVVRLVFIRNLKIEYLGVNGLFSNILTVLSLAELGAGQAIIYSMYKPLAEKDTEKIKSLMRLYKNIYRGVGTAILLLGLLFYPFLDFFIREQPRIPYGELTVIYALAVFQTAIAYFFSYRYSIYTASQNEYVMTGYSVFFSALTSVTQIAVLFLCKNYIAYQCTGLVLFLIRNTVMSGKANRDYPFLKEPAAGLDPESGHEIRKNIFDMFLYKVGTTLESTVDTLLISKFFGLITLGLYSNYHAIAGYSRSLFSTVLGRVIPSLGNLFVTGNEKKQRQVFDALQMVYYWLSTYFAVGLIVLFNPLIVFLFGEEYLLPRAVVTMLIIHITMINFHYPCSFVRDAAGLFRYGKFIPLISAVLNVLFSLVAVRFRGLAGIMEGTVLAALLTYVWYDPYIISKHVLKKRPGGFYIKYLAHWCLLAVLAVTCRYIQQFIHTGSGLADILAGAGLITVIVNGVFLLCYFRSDSLKYVKSTVVRFFGKKK